MTKVLRTPNSRRFFLFLLFLVVTDLAILLDIPVLRQFLGFAFFSIVPGLLIVYILKLGKLGLTEKAVLSVGLSASFLTFFGLFINAVYPLLGYQTPLSTISVTISFSVAVLIIAIIAYLRNRTTSFPILSDFKLNVREKAFLLLPALFPLISILGMYLMNTTDKNTVLMALLFLIPAYIILVAIMRSRVPERIYPAIILLTSLSLLLMTLLRSSHILGVDIHKEYYLFQLTADAQRWQIFQYSTLDSSLVISLLPKIYQSFLNMDPEFVFNISHYFPFAFSPLVVFIISRKYLGNFRAFLTAFFFISQLRFLTFGGGRNDVAVFFFALAMMALFDEGLGGFNKRLLFIIFAATVIVSHYSAAYIFLFLLLLSWIVRQAIPRFLSYRRKPILLENPLTEDDPPNSASRAAVSKTPRLRLESYVTAGALMLFFALLFLWYSQLSAGFRDGVSFIATTLSNLQQFFILESRSTVVIAALGVALGEKGVPHWIEFVFNWLTIAFIAIGVLVTLARRRQMVASLSEEGQLPEFLTQKIAPDFLALSLAGCAIIVLAAVLPVVSKGYDIPRSYFQMMVVLAPFFVIGGITAGRFLRARWAYLIVLVALIPYFMSTSSAMYQLFDFPRNLILNSTSEYYNRFYVSDAESSSAKWVMKYSEEAGKIYVRSYASLILLSQGQGKFPGYEPSSRLSGFQETQKMDGYIYLRYIDIIIDKLTLKYPSVFAEKNKIYASGRAEVYKTAFR